MKASLTVLRVSTFIFPSVIFVVFVLSVIAILTRTIPFSLPELKEGSC